MAIQRLGAKKLRQLSRTTGLDLQMAWAWGDPAVVMLRTFEDHHYTFNRRTSELCEDADGCHVTSCPGGSTYRAEEWDRSGTFGAHGHTQRREG